MIRAPPERSRSASSRWSSPSGSWDPGYTAVESAHKNHDGPDLSPGRGRPELLGGRPAGRVIQDRRGDVFLDNRAGVAVRAEAPHRGLDRPWHDDESAEGPGAEGQVVGLVQQHVLPEASQGLKGLAPEEETVPRVVWISPQGHRPLVAVREEEQGPFRDVATGGHESRGAPDDARLVHGGQDRFEEIRRRDAVRVDEHEDLPSGSAGPSVPPLPGSPPLPFHDERAAGLGQILGPVRARRIRDDDFQGRSGLICERGEQGGEVLLFIPGRNDYGDGRNPTSRAGMESRRGLGHSGHAATRRSYTRSRRRGHAPTEYVRATSRAASCIESRSRRHRRTASAQPFTSVGSKRAPFTPSRTNSGMAR